MKNISRYVFSAVFTIILLSSCAAHNSKSKPRVIDDPRTYGEINFDPLDFPGDNDVITRDVPAVVDTENAIETQLQEKDGTVSKESKQQFAVQVFTSKSSAEARDFKSSIESLLTEEVRVDYQAPYYKVIVGQAMGFDNAQLLLKKVKNLGFSDAWLVRVRE